MLDVISYAQASAIFDTMGWPMIDYCLAIITKGVAHLVATSPYSHINLHHILEFARSFYTEVPLINVSSVLVKYAVTWNVDLPYNINPYIFTTLSFSHGNVMQEQWLYDALSSRGLNELINEINILRFPSIYN